MTNRAQELVIKMQHIQTDRRDFSHIITNITWLAFVGKDHCDLNQHVWAINQEDLLQKYYIQRSQCPPWNFSVEPVSQIVALVHFASPNYTSSSNGITGMHFYSYFPDFSFHNELVGQMLRPSLLFQNRAAC